MMFSISVDHLQSIMDWVKDNQRTAGCSDTVHVVVNESVSGVLQCKLAQATYAVDGTLCPRVQRVTKTFFKEA
jgi:hypothetical protein